MSIVQHLPRPDSSPTFSLDFNHLSKLQKGVTSGGQQQAAFEEEAAHQFEALLIQQMFKIARQNQGNGLFDSDQTRMAQSLGDEQLAMQLSRPGLGLAQALLEQIRGTGSDSRQAAPAQYANLPHLRSQTSMLTAQKDGSIASSITDLLTLITTPARAVERIQGAVRGSPSHITEFVNKMGEAARKAAAETGIPARLILSQAALESGWGKREIAREDGSTSHNLFGIKATGGWKGDVVHVMTTEYIDGSPRKVMQPFRAYASYQESFADYARLISQNSRYKEVVSAPSAEVAAERIQKAGYATDPSYASKLISIMGYFDANRSMPAS